MQTKEELLSDIEKLLNHTPEQRTNINPNYLEYLEHSDLLSIKNNLIKRLGKLNEQDIASLEQFKTVK